jgi:hypothetical protein
VAALARLASVMRPGGDRADVPAPDPGATNEDTRRGAERIAESLRTAGFVDVRTEGLPMRPVDAVCVLGRAPASVRVNEARPPRATPTVADFSATCRESATAAAQESAIFQPGLHRRALTAGAPLQRHPTAMSQRAVEQTLGKLITDEAFREAFYADPAGAAGRAGLALSPSELDALRRLPRRTLDGLCACIDDRICRLYVPAKPTPEEGHS